MILRQNVGIKQEDVISFKNGVLLAGYNANLTRDRYFVVFASDMETRLFDDGIFPKRPEHSWCSREK